MSPALIRLTRLLLLLALVLATSARAQQDERPSTGRPAEPMPESETVPPLVSPPTPRPSERAAPLFETLRIRVDRFDFEGHTAFSTETLRALLVDYTGRTLDTESLLAARDRITRHYIDAGFATSGALLPDQPVGDGRVLIQIVEGRLGTVEIEGARRFAVSYFESRLRRAAEAPLDVGRLELALQRFQQDPLIERVAAKLEPTQTPGVSRLSLSVVEARQEDLVLIAENDRSPSVGEETGRFQLRAANLIGRRDELALGTWFTEGLRDVEVRYALPLNVFDTRLEGRFRYSESEVVEFPFDPLDIESDSLMVSLGLVQPVYRDRRQSLELGLRGDWRKGRSTLSGSLFCFQPGVVDCTPTIAVLRLFADWRWRDLRQAASVRSMLSWGTGWLGATTRAGNVPDGRFVSWLGQAQYVRTLPLDSRLVARVDLQLTEDPLLAFERIAVGGARTVRGYRPNQLVRDNGFVGSLEWRVPVVRRSVGPAWLELAPFFDVGHAWNERFDGGDNSILGLGIGALSHPHERIETSLYWGGRLLGVDRIGSGPIDMGLHFRVKVDVW